MIWSVVSKEEMEGCSSPTFQFQEEALGKENIKLAIVDEGDNLDFVGKDDIVLLRTASKKFIETISKRKLKSTAEDFNVYHLASDKVALSQFLIKNNCCVAPFYTLNDIKDGNIYFVKPRYGNDSSVSSSNICSSRREVIMKINSIYHEYHQDSIICKYLNGEEYTVACTKLDDKIFVYPMSVSGVNPLTWDVAEDLRYKSIDIFLKLGIRHHARIDFCSDSNGDIYAIDVNLIPSLGPKGKWSKCFQISHINYLDALKYVIGSAT